MDLRHFFFLFIPFFSYGESHSYYQGYLLYKNHVEDSIPVVDFNQLIAGMQAARNGIEISEDEITKKQKEFWDNAKQERLAEANCFMTKIAQENGVKELIKGKLAYRVLKEGNGSEVRENDLPIIAYKAKTLANGKEVELYHSGNEPKPILLKSTISGFLQGVVGMREGEKRILYIHPDLAYGHASEFVNPNSQMIFEVEVFPSHVLNRHIEIK